MIRRDTRKESKNGLVLLISISNRSDLLTETPHLYQYKGTGFVVMNREYDCIRGFHNENRLEVTAQCKQQGFKDESLSNWKAIEKGNPKQY